MWSLVQAQAQTGAQTSDAVIVSNATLQETIPGSPNVYATPPTFTVTAHSPQSHPGRIWLRSTDDGLHIWGKVQVEEQGFHWPEQKSEMLSSDHIELWLATSPDVPMPAVGWGNQFGAEELASAKDCTGQKDTPVDDASAVKTCERWYSQQLQYRQYLQRLFVRQWLIAGGQFKTHSFEEFATAAYAGLSANLFRDDLPVLLQPKPDDGLVVEVGREDRQETRHNAAGYSYQTGQQIGYNFHIFIPYTSFPPAWQLKLTDLYLMVDVFSSAPDGHKMGDYSTTAPSRQWGKPSTFNHVRLASPRRFSITPCDDKPEQSDLYDKRYESWFFPTPPGKSSDLRSSFSLINPAGGYMYAPAGVSPEVTQRTYFWKELANGAKVCGPDLAWRRGDTIKRTKFSIEEKYFETKPLPDGWSLLCSGPFTTTHSAFGSGACGSCEILGFNLFAISPQGDITSALNIDQDLSGMDGSPQAADLAVAPDWKRITLYRDYEDKEETDSKSNWTSTTYCLEGHVYHQCGASKQARPPEPANFKELREDN